MEKTEYKTTVIDGKVVVNSHVTKNGRTYVNFVAECATMDAAMRVIDTTMYMDMVKK